MANQPDAINADMARTLLKKVRDKDTSVSDKKQKETEIKDILLQLKKISDSLDVDSKESEEERQRLIKELMKAFDDQGLSIKDQKEKLKEIDEQLNITIETLLSLNISGMNKFFSLFSDMKVLTDTIGKSVTSSKMFKTLEKDIDVIATTTKQNFAWVKNSLSFISQSIMSMYSSVTNLVGRFYQFFKNPTEALKSFGLYVVRQTVDLVEIGLKKLGVFLWNNAIKPIFSMLYKLTAEVIAIAIDITSLIIKMFITIFMWFATTLIPLVFSIIGFLLFDVIPTLFIILTEMFTFFVIEVIPFLVGLVASIASLTVALLPVIAISLLIAVLVVVLLWYVMKVWDKIENWAKNFYNDYLKDFNLDKLKDDFYKLVNYIKTELWPEIKNYWKILTDAGTWIWDVFKDQWEDPNSATHMIMRQINILVPRWVEFFKWIADKVMNAWDFYFGTNGFWDKYVSPVITWIYNVFMKSWEEALKLFEYLKISIGKLGEGLQSVSNSVANAAGKVGGALTSAWKWTTSFFAVGGIVTKPTNAVIGETGTNEAVIPLNKQGMDFIRNSFALDDVSMQQIIQSSDLYKNQMKMFDVISIMSKDVKEIKFSVNEIRDENKIKKPLEDFSLLIKPEILNDIQEEPKQIYDIQDMEKMIMDSSDESNKKLDQVMDMIKSITDKKPNPLMGAGSSSVDPYQEMVRTIAAGIIGVRR